MILFFYLRRFLFALLLLLATGTAASTTASAAMQEWPGLFIPPEYRDAAAELAKQDNGQAVEERLLEAGLAFVFPDTSLSPLQRDNFHDLENRAADQKRGLWQDERYQIKNALDIAALLQQRDSLQIVRGTVYATALQTEFLYLNFEEDWRRDFTIGIPRTDLRHFRRAQLSPEDWTGKTVEVRGWLTSWNGPFITVTHPVQIRILD